MVSLGSRRRLLGGRTVALVMAMAAYSAGVGFVTITLAFARLPAADATVFQVFWAALFLVFGILNGVSVEMTRALSQERVDKERSASAGSVPVAAVAVVAALLMAALGSATAPLWGRVLTVSDQGVSPALLFALVAGIVGFSVHATVAGSLMGRQSWGQYLAVTGAESTVRLILVVATTLVSPTLTHYAWSVCLAEFAWAPLLLASPRLRTVLRETLADVPRRIAARIGAAVAGQGASACLVVGFPMLLRLTTPGPVLAAMPQLLFAITLTRTPIMFPVMAGQGPAVSYLARAHASVARVLAWIAVGTAGLALVAAAVAGWLGPWFVRLLSDYEIGAGTIALLAVDACAIALITLTGIVCQTRGTYAAYLLGWFGALAVAIGVLLTPADVATRAVVALIAGPVVGAALHVGAVLRRHALRGSLREH